MNKNFSRATSTEICDKITITPLADVTKPVSINQYHFSLCSSHLSSENMSYAKDLMGSLSIKLDGNLVLIELVLCFCCVFYATSG